MRAGLCRCGAWGAGLGRKEELLEWIFTDEYIMWVFV